VKLRFINTAETHVLHDLRAVPPRLDGTPPPNLEVETARGSLVALALRDPGEREDDPVIVDLFVDEPLDPELERRAGAKKHGVLGVPSGRLVLADLHDVGITTAGEQAIPPGNYDVTSFEIDWDAEVDDAAEAAAAAASKNGVAFERILGPATGVLICLTVIVLGYAACTTMTSNETVVEAWRSGRWYAAFFGAAWVALLLLWVVTPAGKAGKARAQKRAEFADFVVHLRRIDDRVGDRPSAE
jgi:hypothetical protein